MEGFRGIKAQKKVKKVQKDKKLGKACSNWKVLFKFANCGSCKPLPTLGMAFRDGARRKYMNICKKTGYSTPKNKGERKLELYTTEYYIIN